MKRIIGHVRFRRIKREEAHDITYIKGKEQINGTPV
jgi:hypothetical protein